MGPPLAHLHGGLDRSLCLRGLVLGARWRRVASAMGVGVGARGARRRWARVPLGQRARTHPRTRRGGAPGAVHAGRGRRGRPGHQSFRRPPPGGQCQRVDPGRARPRRPRRSVRRSVRAPRGGPRGAAANRPGRELGTTLVMGAGRVSERLGWQRPALGHRVPTGAGCPARLRRPSPASVTPRRSPGWMPASVPRDHPRRTSRCPTPSLVRRRSRPRARRP